MGTSLTAILLFIAVLSVFYPLMKLNTNPPANPSVNNLLCVTPAFAGILVVLLPTEETSFSTVLALLPFIMIATTFILLITKGRKRDSMHHH